MELSDRNKLFVGLKLDTGLRRQLEAVSGPDRKYVSKEDSTFLRICRIGEAVYVGKLIHERLSTDRVDDIKRNIHSILQRLFPDERLPQHLEIMSTVVEPPGVERSGEERALFR